MTTIKKVVDLHLVNIIEQSLYEELIEADKKFRKSNPDENEALDELFIVEGKCVEKFEAFNSLISSLLDSYQLSIKQFNEVQANFKNVNHRCIDFQFDLIENTLLAIDDEIDRT